MKMKNRNDTASGLRHQEAGHGSALFATLAAAIIVAVLAFSPAKAFASGSGRPGGQAGAGIPGPAASRRKKQRIVHTAVKYCLHINQPRPGMRKKKRYTIKPALSMLLRK